jgi:hypothetical protein
MNSGIYSLLRYGSRIGNKFFVIVSNKTKYPPKVKYKPMFVKDRDMFPNKGAFKLIKSLISNWSNGLIMFNNVFIVLVINYKCTEK